jgi:hypothetical protein
MDYLRIKAKTTTITKTTNSPIPLGFSAFRSLGIF